MRPTCTYLLAVPSKPGSVSGCGAAACVENCDNEGIAASTFYNPTESKVNTLMHTVGARPRGSGTFARLQDESESGQRDRQRNHGVASPAGHRRLELLLRESRAALAAAPPHRR